MFKSEKLDGFVKVDHSVGSGWVVVTIWNPTTKEFKCVTCDDLEYQYGDGFVDREFTFEERDYMLRRMPWFGGSKEIKQQYMEWKYQESLKAGRILVGMTVEVFKGRKYPIGTTGVVEGFSEYRDRYGRVCTTYVVTTDGKRIPRENCKPIA